MKVIVCDMSGIVTNRGENNIELLKTLQALKNIKCSFCTGKGYRGASSTIFCYDFNLPFICENGSVITSREGDVLYSDSMDYNKVEKMLHALVEYPFEFLAYVDLKTHKYKFLRGTKKLSESLSQPWFYSEEIYDDVDLFLKNIDKNSICRITTRRLEIEISSDILREFHVVVSEKEFHSICNKGINKGTGVKKLAEMLSIELNDVIIIGNDINDIDMFRIKECYKIATGMLPPPKELQTLANKYVPINELSSFIKNLDLNEMV